jgi:hypothetical protein
MLAIASALFIAQAASAQAPPTPPAPTPPPCEAPEFRALDFWVGEWDVYQAGGNRLVAHSKIEKLYRDCAIRENWMPLGGAGGGSLSGYDPASKRWHQTWFGSAPGPVAFEGGPVAGGMVLTGWWAGSGPNGEDGLTRMTYSPAGEGAVRQHGEFSADHGVSWATSFDLIYRPASRPE